MPEHTATEHGGDDDDEGPEYDPFADPVPAAATSARSASYEPSKLHEPQPDNSAPPSTALPGGALGAGNLVSMVAEQVALRAQIMRNLRESSEGVGLAALPSASCAPSPPEGVCGGIARGPTDNAALSLLASPPAGPPPEPAALQGKQAGAPPMKQPPASPPQSKSGGSEPLPASWPGRSLLGVKAPPANRADPIPTKPPPIARPKISGADAPGTCSEPILVKAPPSAPSTVISACIAPSPEIQGCRCIVATDSLGLSAMPAPELLNELPPGPPIECPPSLLPELPPGPPPDPCPLLGADAQAGVLLPQPGMLATSPSPLLQIGLAPGTAAIPTFGSLHATPGGLGLAPVGLLPFSNISLQASPAFLPPPPSLLPVASVELPPLPLLPQLPPKSPGVAVPVAPLRATGPAQTGLKVETWEEHRSPQGVLYFYCKRTGESRWARPDGRDNIVIAATSLSGPTVPPAVDAKTQMGEPESWETIGRTGWMRVETDKGFRYFFHKKTKKTAWICPAEIAKEVAELDGVLGANTDSGAPADSTAPANLDSDMAAAPSGVAADDVAEPVSRAERVEKRKRQSEQEQKTSRENRALLNFKQLLLEKGVNAFDKYEKWVPKLLHDVRFTAIKGQKERKVLFETLCKRIDAERKKQASSTKKSGRESFRELLAKANDMGLLHDRAPADSVQRALEARFGDDDRWTAVPAKERDRLIAEVSAEATAKKNVEREKALHAFRGLVSSYLSTRETDPPPWHVARRRLQEDPRWAAVESLAEREKAYEAAVRGLKEAQRQHSRKQKREDDDAESVRRKRRLSEMEESFRSMLAERIKVPFTLDWKDAQSHLDKGWLKNCKVDDEEQERLFVEYKQGMIVERQRAFLLLLGNISADMLGPHMDFETAFRVVVETASTSAFAGLPEDVLRAAWEAWRDKAHEQAVEVCQKWLRSCEHFRGTEGINMEGAEFNCLVDRLEATDVRFRRVGARPADQRRLVAERLRELRELRKRGRGPLDEDEVE